MRKAIAIILTAMAMAGCTELENFNIASVRDADTMVKTESFNDYMAKARWGDGEAYLKLAECYILGDGVKPDYHSRRNNEDKAQTYIRWAREAADKAKLRTAWANEARSKAQLRMKWAREAIEKAKNN